DSRMSSAGGPDQRPERRPKRAAFRTESNGLHPAASPSTSPLFMNHRPERRPKRAAFRTESNGLHPAAQRPEHSAPCPTAGPSTSPPPLRAAAALGVISCALLFCACPLQVYEYDAGPEAGGGAGGGGGGGTTGTGG